MSEPKKSVDYYKEIFDILDVEKLGTLQLSDVSKALKKIGQPISE